MNHTFFIAKRFLHALIGQKYLATMLRICVLSVTLSTTALVVIIAVMHGFHRATNAALQGIHHDIILQAPAGVYLDAPKITAIIHKEFGSVVAQTIPTAYAHVIVQADDTADISHVVLLQAHDIQSYPSDHRIVTMTHWYDQQKDQSIPLGTVLIGKTLARDLHVQEKRPLRLLAAHVEKSSSKRRSARASIGLEEFQVQVVGTFSSGIEDFDERVIFCSLDTYYALFPQAGVTQIGIILKKSISSQKIVERLKERFNLDIVRWQELYPSLLNALALEYSAMMLVFILVLSIVSITLSSLLMMYLFYQQRSLAVCRAMGMKTSQLRLIFTLVNLIISFISTLVGIGFGVAMSWFLDNYELIPLPDVYTINHVPADIHWPAVFLVFFIMNSISFLTSWLVTRRIKLMNMARVIKQHGM